MNDDAVLIAGPTASGKTSFALKIADEARANGRDPVIINADSMQVYKELRLLTARPSVQEEEKCRHALYGFVSAKETFNTGAWLSTVAHLLDESKSEVVDSKSEVLPIFVGGTGLYFNALTKGFANIPEVSDATREGVRRLHNEENHQLIYQILYDKDPEAARLFKPADTQRILRALEVFEETGKSILHWQSENQQSPLVDPTHCRKYILLPPRERLYQRINARFVKMIEAGAMEEVQVLRDMELPTHLPAMKAIGVPQLMSVLEEAWSLEEAIEDAQRESRRYAKRQMTWWRNQMGDDWERIDPG